MGSQRSEMFITYTAIRQDLFGFFPQAAAHQGDLEASSSVFASLKLILT